MRGASTHGEQQLLGGLHGKRAQKLGDVQYRGGRAAPLLLRQPQKTPVSKVAKRVCVCVCEHARESLRERELERERA